MSLPNNGKLGASLSAVAGGWSVRLRNARNGSKWSPLNAVDCTLPCVLTEPVISLHVFLVNVHVSHDRTWALVGMLYIWEVLTDWLISELDTETAVRSLWLNVSHVAVSLWRFRLWINHGWQPMWEIINLTSEQQAIASPNLSVQQWNEISHITQLISHAHDS